MEEGKRVSPSVPYGYYRNPKNKQELLVDKESSKVVKRIFRLVIEVYGVTQIADILTKDKVLFCKRRKARVSKSDEQVIRRKKRRKVSRG